jgi:hypothetical protein
VAGWLWLGLLGGLMGLVRFQDGPLLGLALIDLPRARWRVLLLIPGALAAFAPQLAVERVIFGTWLPYRPPEFAFQPFPGHYLDVLFSSHNGLFIWSPIALAAVAGLFLIPDRALRLAYAWALLVELAIQGAAPDWWGGHSFGQRRLLDLLPFMSLGLAAVALRLGVVRSWVAATLLGLWNLLLIANFSYVLRTDHDPGYGGLLAGQLAALPDLPRLFGQGGVVRDLLLWPALHRPFEPAAGLLLLVLEAACLGAGVMLARGRIRIPRQRQMELR